MSYDASHPTDKDRARYALGDTSNDVATELLSDVTITTELSARDYNLGVAILAEGLAARYAQLPTSVSDSGTSVSWADRVDDWRKTAKDYRALAAQELGVATTGLTSRAAVVAVW